MNWITIAAGSALALGLTAGAAGASTVTLTFNGLAATPAQKVNLNEISTPKSFTNLPAGGFAMSDGTNDFFAWCIDIFDTIKTATYNVQRPGQVTDGKEADLNRLFTNNGAVSVSSAVNSAAFQAAIWEIVYETDSVYDLATGNLQVSNNAGVVALAQEWLDNLGTAAGTYLLTFYESETSQDLVTGVPGGGGENPPPVPLPAGMVLLLTGLGALGVARRNRLA